MKNIRAAAALVLLLAMLMSLGGCAWMILPGGEEADEPAVSEGIGASETSGKADTPSEPAETKAPEISEEENAQMYKDSCETATYEEIARNPDNYTGKDLYFQGQIIQVSEGLFDSITYRISVTPGKYGLWEDPVYVTYTIPEGSMKFLEEDIVDFYGVCQGDYTYTTIMGAKVTVPKVDAKYIELAEEIMTPEANFDEEAVLAQLEVTEYHYKTDWYNYAFLVIKNNSEYDLDISAAVKFLDDEDALVGADDTYEDPVQAGTETILCVTSDTKYDHISYELGASISEYYEGVVAELSYEATKGKKKQIVTVTNNGEDPAEFVQGYGLFFKGEKVVGFDSAYFTDDDSQIKPGKSVTKELSCYNKYDSVQFYFTGRK